MSFGRDPFAVVGDDDVRRTDRRADHSTETSTRAASRFSQASMALVTTFKNGPVQQVGIELKRRQVGSRLPDRARPALLRRGIFISSTTSPTVSFRSAATRSGSRSLLNVSMSMTRLEICSWFFSTIRQPRRTTSLSSSFKPILDQVAAAADALQDVLDVVRERGDRLAHGRQPLGLEHGRVVRRVLDRQRRLVADGDHQLEMLFGELVDGAAGDEHLPGGV